MSEEADRILIQVQKDDIVARLKELSHPAFKVQKKKFMAIERFKKPGGKTTEGSLSHLIPIVSEKTDTHWDYLLKEMQWLATDFNSERSRHIAFRKKLALSVNSYQTTQRQRHHRAIETAVNFQRRTALRIMRDVRQKWWEKIDKIIQYQDRRNLEKSQSIEMNRQLVRLIHQTERYNQKNLQNNTVDDKIEAALAASSQERRRRRRVQNYALLGNNKNYDDDTDAHSIASYMKRQGDIEADDDDISDGSYQQPHDDEILDDESTVRAAEEIEMQERRLSKFTVDPEELQLLRDEAALDINIVLDRMKHITSDDGTPTVQEPKDDNLDTLMAASDSSESIMATENDDDNDDDDDDDDNPMSDEEFVQSDNEILVDDETTLLEEERLPQELTAEQELALLQQENELSVDELRKRYAQAILDNDDDTIARDDTEESSATTPDDDNKTASLTTQLIRPENEEAIDEEFIPDEPAVDDETTMEAEEKLGADMTYEQEISLLHAENTMSVEELRQKYLGGGGGTNDRPHLEELLQNSVEDEENDDEFQPDMSDMVDDETTMEAEERLGQDISAQDEIAMLQEEGSMSLEALRNKYHLVKEPSIPIQPTVPRTTRRRKRSRDQKSDEEGAEKKQKIDADEGARALDRLEASAHTYQNTKASRPFLVPSWVKLREYQQTGLNWLVSLQSRRLNGILADEMVRVNC